MTSIRRAPWYSMWLVLPLLAPAGAWAQACAKTSIVAPTPFMGKHGEVFRTADGSTFKVDHAHEYLYAYHPDVTLCEGRGTLLIGGKSIDILPVRADAASLAGHASNVGATEAAHTVVLRVRGCDYFLADGPRGLYLLQWYGGYDPDRGDGIGGEIAGYGFQNVLYENGREGRLYVDDYRLGKEEALKKLREKCRLG